MRLPLHIHTYCLRIYFLQLGKYIFVQWKQKLIKVRNSYIITRKTTLNVQPILHDLRGGVLQHRNAVYFVHFFDPCGRYGRFNGVTDRSNIVHQLQLRRTKGYFQGKTTLSNYKGIIDLRN